MPRSGVDTRRAVELLAIDRFLMTAAHETKRAGVLVTSIQKCADEPTLLCIASPKGHVIETLIRDSRHFGVCRLDPEDRVLLRRFERTLPAHERIRDDPFDALEVERLVSNAPILKRSTLAFDCEVVRHFDLEADHELYIGAVLAARFANPAP